MLIDILKEALRLMKKNLNLTQLIFFFFIILTIFAPVFVGVKINARIIPMLIMFFASICVVLAGIFFAFKKSLEYEISPPKTNNPYDLPPLYFAEFFQGVGKYAKEFLLAGIFVLFILFLTGFCYHLTINHFVEIPQKFIDASSSGIINDNSKLIEFISSLTPKERSCIEKIGIITLGYMMLFGFLTMLYPIALIYEKKNFLISFFISLKKLIKNLPISIVLFLFFNFIIAILGGLSAAFVDNIFISVFCILLQCYLYVWYILALFLYYEKTK